MLIFKTKYQTIHLLSTNATEPGTVPIPDINTQGGVLFIENISSQESSNTEQGSTQQGDSDHTKTLLYQLSGSSTSVPTYLPTFSQIKEFAWEVGIPLVEYAICQFVVEPILHIKFDGSDFSDASLLGNLSPTSSLQNIMSLLGTFYDAANTLPHNYFSLEV